MTKHTKRIIFVLFVIALAGLTGCAGTPKKAGEPTTPETEPPPPFVALQFPSIPIPKGTELDRDKTFIYESGSGEVKVGRLVFSVWNKPQEVVDYFREEMSKNGWKLLRTIEHTETILLYERKGEVATVMIDSSLGKTYIEIQIGPK